ncbi:MAG: hypothetical protein WCP16_19065 [Pseudanabaena sp. ELA645]|jgi:hypothetical protein
MKEIIRNVKQTIEQKKILWAYPITKKLENYHHNLAVQWAIECIKIYSSEIKPNKLSQLNRYIQEAIDSQNILSSLESDEIIREIWYIPERDDFQAAVSRLWGAISAFKKGDEHGGIMEATMSIELLLPNISDHRLLDRYLEVAVNICEEYESQS